LLYYKLSTNSDTILVILFNEKPSSGFLEMIKSGFFIAVANSKILRKSVGG